VSISLAISKPILVSITIYPKLMKNNAIFNVSELYLVLPVCFRSKMIRIVIIGTKIKPVKHDKCKVNGCFFIFMHLFGAVKLDCCDLTDRYQ
jgi:hypothetical protein